MNEKGGKGSRRADAEVSREGEGGGTHIGLRIRVCPLGQQQRGSLGLTIVTGIVQWGRAVLREREGSVNMMAARWLRGWALPDEWAVGKATYLQDRTVRLRREDL